eukprot:6768588-Alexandrium_andersonii.AAC.1
MPADLAAAVGERHYGYPLRSLPGCQPNVLLHFLGASPEHERHEGGSACNAEEARKLVLSLIHISEPTRLALI